MPARPHSTFLLGPFLSQECLIRNIFLLTRTSTQKSSSLPASPPPAPRNLGWAHFHPPGRFTCPPPGLGRGPRGGAGDARAATRVRGRVCATGNGRGARPGGQRDRSNPEAASPPRRGAPRRVPPIPAALGRPSVRACQSRAPALAGGRALGLDGIAFTYHPVSSWRPRGARRAAETDGQTRARSKRTGGGTAAGSRVARPVAPPVVGVIRKGPPPGGGAPPHPPRRSAGPRHPHLRVPTPTPSCVWRDSPRSTIMELPRNPNGTLTTTLLKMRKPSLGEMKRQRSGSHTLPGSPEC